MMRRLCLSFIVFMTLTCPQARAETIVRSVYQTDFIGLPVSRAYLTMTLDEKGYRIEGSGRSSPVARILVPMKAQFKVHGRLSAAGLLPENFEAHVTAGKDRYDIDLKLKNGAVTKESATPLTPAPDLVAVTKEMKRGVIDPLSAFLVPYRAAQPEKVCDRTLPIYTGRERFDLKLTPLRRERVSLPGFYEGEAQVCAARYLPKGGHRAGKKEIKYMIENKAMEAWFVPLPQASLMGLYKVEIGTKLGPAVIRLDKAELGPMPDKKM